MTDWQHVDAELLQDLYKPENKIHLYCINFVVPPICLLSPPSDDILEKIKLLRNCYDCFIQSGSRNKAALGMSDVTVRSVKLAWHGSHTCTYITGTYMIQMQHPDSSFTLRRAKMWIE